MWVAGIINAVVMLALAIGLSLLSPLCVPCLSIFVGLASGFLGCVMAKPTDDGSSKKTGAIVGGLGGIGAFLGHIIGSVINATQMGPEGSQQLFEQLGLPSTSLDPNAYYAGLAASTLCLGILDIILLAGLGLLGGMIWWNINSKKQASINPV